MISSFLIMPPDIFFSGLKISSSSPSSEARSVTCLRYSGGIIR